MRTVLALAVGYALGARAGGRQLAELERSLKALLQTDEFADVVAAARTQVGAGLRDLATVVDGGVGAEPADGDLVARVRRLAGLD